jgi:hypothetical protein
MRNFRFLLPDQADGYQGSRLSRWFLVGLTVLTTVRSLFHMFAEDGGANSIAGMPKGDGAIWENLVAVFGLWGFAQLVIALIGWVIILRYPFLIPFGLSIQLVDWLGRGFYEQYKEIITEADAAPGEVGNLIFPPLVAIALWFSLPKKPPV